MKKLDNTSRKRRKLRNVVLGGLGLVLVLALAMLAFVYNSVQNTAEEMHEKLERSQPEKRITEVDVEKKDPISFLLLGVDERSNDKGRSDTMIVVTVNPQEESMYMFNIPRDTRTTIVGKGIEDKINHAYAYGGVSMSVATVENFLDIPIDYYVKVNMQAFSDIVDAIDGVTVYNKLEWEDDGTYKKGYIYEKGEITLSTGAEALGYVRMRKDDPRGDFGRNERQRQVIKAIIEKGARLSSITKFDDILTIIGGNVKTNMTFKEMNDLRKHYASSREIINEMEIQGKGEVIGGIYYFIVPEIERVKISTLLKGNLDIDETRQVE